MSEQLNRHLAEKAQQNEDAWVEQGYDLRNRMQRIEAEYQRSDDMTRNEAQRMAWQVMHTAEERERFRLMELHQSQLLLTDARNTNQHQVLVIHCFSPTRLFEKSRVEQNTGEAVAQQRRSHRKMASLGVFAPGW